MFSGIIEAIGLIKNITVHNACKKLIISSQMPFNDIAIGHSIAINGVCLTITACSENSFDITAVPETLRLSNLSQLKIGDEVNLERALSTTARIGGHYVQGHVDGMGEILALEKNQGEAWLIKISLAPTLKPYVIKKGYICIDGMSVTVMDVYPDAFTLTLIPHTQAVTIAKQYKIGSTVNIEVDILGKYIESFLGAYAHDKSF